MTESKREPSFSPFFIFLLTLLLGMIGMLLYLIQEGEKRSSQAQKLKKQGLPLSKNLLKTAGRPSEIFISQLGRSIKEKERLAAVRKIQLLGSEKGYLLFPFFKDPAPKVRIAAYQVLGDLRYLGGLSQVVSYLEKEPNPTVKICGFSALRKILENRYPKSKGNKECKKALEFLIRQLRAKEKLCQRYAEQTLISITRQEPPVFLKTQQEKQKYWKEWLRNQPQ